MNENIARISGWDLSNWNDSTIFIIHPLVLFLLFAVLVNKINSIETILRETLWIFWDFNLCIINMCGSGEMSEEPQNLNDPWLSVG